MKYRKKPVVIEAIQYNGKNAQDVINFAKSSGRKVSMDRDSSRKIDFLEVETLEGFMYADKGDWIIRGVKGEVYPCKPVIFEMTYEPAGQDGGVE